MKDVWVFVENLELDASIGVLESEKHHRQRIQVDIRLQLAHERVNDSHYADYRVPADTARRIVEAGHIELVETLAKRIAESCLDDPLVNKATVTVRKPDAIADARAAGIEMTLSK